MRHTRCLLGAVVLVTAILYPAVGAAQDAQVVTGRVTHATTGQPLAGVSVSVRGTAVGTMTDGQGAYRLPLPSDATALVFSYIGYRTLAAEISGAELDVVLEPEAIGLEGLVVTALGMTRERRDVGYSIQALSGEAISQTPDLNLVNALSGRAAGLQVTNAGPVGGSARIVIRGNSSISGDNQPLFVVDGVPIDNAADTNTGYGGGTGGGIDYGNAASDIDPANIESITVLKGPNAAALYGSRAANGAIVITTKSGRSAGGLGITASNAFMFSTPLRLPHYQNVYGQGFNGEFSYVDGAQGGVNDGVDESWGPPMLCSQDQLIDQFFGQQQPFCPQPNNVRDFFSGGFENTTNVAVARSGDRGHFRFSINRNDADGMGPGGEVQRTAFGLSGGVQVTDRLELDASGMYTRRTGENLPGTGYSSDNYIQQFTWFGRQLDLDLLKDHKNEDGTPNSWSYNYHDNPYWIAYENWNQDKRDRIFGSVNARYQLTTWLSASLRTGRDWYQHNRKRVNAMFGINTPDGGFGEEVIERSETNTDFLLTATRGLSPDLTLTTTAGAARRDNEIRRHNIAVSNLVVPDIYTLQNAGSTPDVSDFFSQKRINSLLGMVNANYRGYLNMEVTGRNDWSSTLPEENNSYFYPSVSTSLVFTDAFGVRSSILSSGKLRAAWARVGNDTDPYQLLPIYQSTAAWEGIPRYTVPNRLPNVNLKPEQTSAWEFGADLGFFNERLGFVLTYYDERTRNQILDVAISPSSGFTSQMINAGEVRNWGYELQLEATPVRLDNGFRWQSTINFAVPKNEVVDLYGDIDAYRLGAAYWSLEVQARKGHPFGVLWGNERLRDEQGRVVVDGNGMPLVDPTPTVLGNYNPDWVAGMYNQFSYRDFDLGFLLDTKQGGSLFSTTVWFNRYSGVAEETLGGRQDGHCEPGILIEGVKEDGTPNDVRVCPQDYWHGIFPNRHDDGVIDASFIKLREVVLGWNVPDHVLARVGFSRARLALVGRNLWLRTPSENRHVDPETAFDTGNRQGLEFGQFPSARQIGLTLSIQP